MTTPKKRCELGSIFQLISKGFTKAQIQKKLDLKANALANHLRKLEELGNIRRVGKFKIDLLSSSLKHPGVTKNKVHIGFNKRGHAHNITVHFNKKINLKDLPKVKQEKKAKLFEVLDFGSLKFVRKGFTIWINNHNLTLYSNNSYYSGDSLKAKFMALREVDNLIQNLIWKYNFPQVYGIEVFREHYGLIFNKFAKWLNKKGRKMYVQDKKGKTILWVDKSRKDDIGLEEFEGEDPLVINKADNFFESKERTGWVDDTPIVKENVKRINDHEKVLNKSMKVLEGYAQQIALHLEVESKQLTNLERQDKHFENQTKLFEEILKELKKR